MKWVRYYILSEKNANKGILQSKSKEFGTTHIQMMVYVTVHSLDSVL